MSIDRSDWLARYRQAWLDKDADAAAELFTEDAVYREQAFAPPFTGRDAIRQYWARVTASQADIDLTYGAPVAVGDRLAVEWWVTLTHGGAPVTLAGEFMLRFDAGGRCRELREYWVMSEDRREPPEGWGR